MATAHRIGGRKRIYLRDYRGRFRPKYGYTPKGTRVAQQRPFQIARARTAEIKRNKHLTDLMLKDLKLYQHARRNPSKFTRPPKRK